MNTDFPYLAYNNFLSNNAGYTIDQGTENAAAPISNAYNSDRLKPALPKSGSGGNFRVTFDFDSNTPAEVFIIGADRHDSSGFKTTGINFKLDYWDGAAYTTIISSTALTAEDRSDIYKLPSHTLGLNGAVYQYRLQYSSVTASSNFKIPELFLGTGLELPPVDFGFDEYNEVYKGNKFQALSGRVYKTLHYRRLELDPSWSVLSRQDYDVAVTAFREDCLEILKSFWFAWMPDSKPGECYFMFHDGDNAAYKQISAVHRSFALKLVEDI